MRRHNELRAPAVALVAAMVSIGALLVLLFVVGRGGIG